MNTDVADARSRAKSLRAHCRLFSPSPLKDRSGSRGASFENIGYPRTLKRNPVYPRKQLSTVLGRQRPIRRKRSRLGVQTSITAVPVKFETAQREIGSSADRNATRVTCYIGKCRELAMHLAGQPLELLVSFWLRLRRLQPSLDTEIEQISTKIKRTLLLVLYHRLRSP